MRPRLLTAAVVGICLVAAAFLVVVPLVTLVRRVWIEGRHQLQAVLTAPGLGRAIAHSFELAAGATVTAVVVGTALALVLHRPTLPARRLWRLAVVLPVLVPDYVLGYSWLRSYSTGGLTDQLIGVTWDGVEGPLGVVIAVAVNLVPLVWIVVGSALATRVEPAAVRAARMAGAGPLTVLRTITLPLLRPAIATAAVLTFVLSMASFAIPQVLGSSSGFDTITTRVYADLTRSSDPALFIEALTLALLLVVVTAVVAVPADVLVVRGRTTRLAVTDPAGDAGRRRGGDVVAVVCVLAYLLLTVVVPMVALVATALTRAVGLAPTPRNWTLSNFSAVVTASNVDALGRSLLLAVAAASVLVILGGSVALVERRRIGRPLPHLVTLTLVLPGSTLAVAMLLSYGRWLSDSIVIIWIAYLAKLWAFAHRPVAGAVDRLPPEEVYAARGSGATPLAALRTVVLRPLAPALFAGWAVCFLTALHEVTMSSLLYGPGNETLAVAVLNSEELGRIGLTAALSVLLTLVVLVPAALLWLIAVRLGRETAARTRVPEPVHAG